MGADNRIIVPVIDGSIAGTPGSVNPGDRHAVTAQWHKHVLTVNLSDNLSGASFLVGATTEAEVECTTEFGSGQVIVDARMSGNASEDAQTLTGRPAVRATDLTRASCPVARANAIVSL